MIIITREIFTVLITMMEIIQKWSEISPKKTIDTQETKKTFIKKEKRSWVSKCTKNIVEIKVE